MKYWKPAAPLAAVLICGCAALQNLDVNSMTGGRVSNEQFQSATKVATAVHHGVADISESEEYYIGRAVAAQILSRYEPLDDPALNLYAQKIVQAVSMASDRPSIYRGYHVQILKSSEVNAFAAPGGFIFVTTGLLKLTRSEDELACVLAHEVAHVAKKHGLKTIKTSRLTSAFALLGTEAAKNYTSSQVAQLTDVFKGTVDDVVNNLVVKGYSRDKEYEADKFGAQYARAANYDPRALTAFLHRMEAADTAGAGGMFKTHPKASKRIDELGTLSPSADYRPSPVRERRFKAAMTL
ncbi:MAG: M48 family metalloprotease [Elusimicrobia bacterium]|nr:M48 family metalloprotease [Elusimicrobiota bacterium]